MIIFSGKMREMIRELNISRNVFYLPILLVVIVSLLIFLFATIYKNLLIIIILLFLLSIIIIIALWHWVYMVRKNPSLLGDETHRERMRAFDNNYATNLRFHKDGLDMKISPQNHSSNPNYHKNKQ